MSNFGMNCPPYGQNMNRQYNGQTGQYNPRGDHMGFPPRFGGPRNHNPHFSQSRGGWNHPPCAQPRPPPQHPGNQPRPGPPQQHPGNQPRPPPQHVGIQPPHLNRPVNNIWCDPSLYQPRPPPRPQYPGGHFGVGAGGRGRGCDRGRGRGRGGPGGFGRGQGWSGGGGGNHQQHQQGRQNHHNANPENKKKKAKVDKRDLPENNLFHCEVCDRGFKSEEKFHEHTSNHVQCSVEGCRYVAAEKLVKLHIMSQHRTGLAKKIWSLESPEDIKKWVQERKRNFPTKENITRKAQDAQERRNRGEVIQTKQFGKMRGRGRGRRGWHQQSNSHTEPGFSHSAGSHSGGSAQKRPSQDGGMATDDASSPSQKKRRTECGADGSDGKETSVDAKDPLSLLIEGSGGSSNDEDDDEADAKPKIPEGQALASLISSYGSDSGEEDAAQDADNKLSVKTDNTQGGDDTSRPQKKPPHPSANPSNGNHHQQRHKIRKPALLEMLLANDIRHERNIILQCVHYIVKTKFLGVCSEKKVVDGQ